MNEQDKNSINLMLEPTLVEPVRETVPTLPSYKFSERDIPSISAGTVDEASLSEAEKAWVEQYAQQINIADVEQIVQYGQAAQKNISDFSVSVLEKVKTYDLGEVGTSLQELTIALDETNAPHKKGFFRIFQGVKRNLDAVKANYAKAESNVERIEHNLQQHQEALIRDISMYQKMFELNLQQYKELTLYVIAGRKALDDARTGKLQRLHEIAEASGKQEDAQAYKDFEDLCYRFEKKLSNLELTRMIAIQQAPQVRMLQNNDREMLDKIQSSLVNTIPLWRNQLVLSLGIGHTRKAIDAQSALANKTNELLLKNSEALKMATIETAKEAERPIVEIDTLRQCNKDLIMSINEVVKIHTQGIEQRKSAQRELIKIEVELEQALLESAH